jgi:hypothetical protein
VRCDGLEGRGTLLATAPRAAPVGIVEGLFETLFWMLFQAFVRIGTSKVLEWRRRAVSVLLWPARQNIFVEVERE